MKKKIGAAFNFVFSNTPTLREILYYYYQEKIILNIYSSPKQCFRHFVFKIFFNHYHSLCQLHFVCHTLSVTLCPSYCLSHIVHHTFSDIVSLALNVSFRAQNQTHSVIFWVQKLKHYVRFWIQKILKTIGKLHHL